MIGLTRWCIAHRRWVILGWIAIAIGTTVIAGAVRADRADERVCLVGEDEPRMQEPGNRCVGGEAGAAADLRL